MRIVFKDGNVAFLKNVEKVYIENEDVTIETKRFRDIITDIKEDVGERLGVTEYVEHLKSEG